MNAGALLAAYHGCDAVTRDDLVSGRLKNLQASENKYDWLGSGAYFFENDAARAFPKDQDVLLRALDSAVFNFIHKARELENAPAFQAVRGAFLQGEEVAPSSGFYARTHVQIALRDNSCVLGWFLPPDATLMTTAQYDDALIRRVAMQRNRKPRRVAPRATPPEA